MIPILYDQNETEFRTNGLGMLSDAVSCYVDFEVNGVYELEMRYPVDGRRYGDIQERSLILAKPSPHAEPQPFRVYRITAPMRGTVTVYARHIAYDLMGIPVAPFQAANAPAAMQGLSDNAAVDCPFTFSTDKETVAAMEVKVPKSIWSQFGGSEGSVLDVYGGEYEFDRFAVRLHKRLGEDRGAAIRYGKNLTTLEQDKNCANVYTGVYPYWTNADGALVTLPERILYAEGNFDHVRIMTLDLSEDFEEAPTEDQLRSRAMSYMKANNIGVPDISWTIGFVNLAQTEEYKDKAILEEIHWGDTVTVILPKMGINVSARAVKARHNVLLDRYESITLGKVKANISDTIADNSQKILIESQKRLSADGKINAELAIQDGKIQARVEKIGGTPESFAWDMQTDHFSFVATEKEVMRIDKDGAVVRGKIIALTGEIGGFDIMADYLSYNGQTWNGSKSIGAYLGINGLQLGTKFKVDMYGNLYAASGTFEGNVYSKNIQYGGNCGTFSGYGLTSGTVTGGSGGAISYGGVSTYNTTSGINSSLSYADYANGVFSGWNTAAYCKASVGAFTGLTTSDLTYQGYDVVWRTIKDGNGLSQTVLARAS